MAVSSGRVRRLWSKEEDDILRGAAEAQAVSSNGFVKDWCSISKMLPGRTNKDCRKRYSKVTKGVNKGSWARDEDERLVRAMEACGPSWQLIAERVGTRHAEQCAKRWQHSLDPSIDRSEWTAEDDQTLIDAVNTVGRSWRTISKNYFPRRSTTDIKNHFEYVSRRRKHSDESFKSAGDDRRSREFEESLSESSSDMVDETGTTDLNRNTSQYQSQIPHQHILTASHPGPDVMTEYSPHSPADRNSLGFRSEDMMNMRPHSNMGNISNIQPYTNDLSLNTFYTSPTTLNSTMGNASDTRSPQALSMAPFAQMNSHFSSGTNSSVSSWNQHDQPFSAAPQMSTYPVTSGGLDTADTVHATNPGYLHDQLPSGSRSPSAGCTLVLEQIPPENVGIILDPLVRSGVNVRLKLYNGD